MYWSSFCVSVTLDMLVDRYKNRCKHWTTTCPSGPGLSFRHTQTHTHKEKGERKKERVMEEQEEGGPGGASDVCPGPSISAPLSSL